MLLYIIFIYLSSSLNRVTQHWLYTIVQLFTVGSSNSSSIVRKVLLLLLISQSIQYQRTVCTISARNKSTRVLFLINAALLCVDGDGGCGCGGEELRLLRIKALVTSATTHHCLQQRQQYYYLNKNNIGCNHSLADIVT